MPEITKTGAEPAFRVPSVVWVGLTALGVLAYFLGLNIPLVGPDEPRYAQVAREMFERGDWITPTLGGSHWFEKPALLYWLEIAGFQLLGVTEFAARLGPAIFGLATVACLWFLGRSVEKSSSGRSTGLAATLALISASTLGILVFAHGASFDIIITFPITAALVSFFVYDRSTTLHRNAASGRSGLISLGSFYFFVGVALLAKGLIGAVFPYAIVAFYFILSRRMPTGRLLLSLAWGTMLAALVAAVWYLPMYHRHGWEFIDEFIIQQHFQRFTSNKYQHPQPFYFYLWVLPLMTLPWLPLLAAAIWRYGKKPFQNVSTEAKVLKTVDSDLLRFAIAWLLVPLVFFSFSGSKLPGYILPAVPAAVILTATFAHTLAAESRKWMTAILTTTFLVFAVTIGLIFTVVPRFANADSAKGLIEAAKAQGHSSERVFGLHTVSHSAEFYAAGSLLRDPDGKQKKLYGVGEIEPEMRRAGEHKALVLVPSEYARQLTDALFLHPTLIADNGDLSIIAVSLE